MEIKVNDKSFFVDKNDNQKHPNHIRHWSRVNNGSWEPHTFKIFDEFIDDQYSYIDLGAYIGSTVLYGSLTAKHTYAVEPDVVALDVLKNNISANPHLKSKITLYEGAIYDKNGTMGLINNRAGFGDSESKIVAEHIQGTKLVDVMSFNTFVDIYNIIDCNFIKMDIEGAECTVVPAMKDFCDEYRPVLYISLHGNFTQMSRELMLDVFNIYNKFYVASTRKEIKLEEVFNSREIIVL